ncbi:CHAD domain-containing protein [Geodermatophilus sp. SYSU D00691]
MTDVHVEIERKFDVEADFVLPDLSAVEGVASVDGPEERQLEAVYHDTADLRLARAKVTMRRRTGGPDAGWHVKLPGVDGARRELHSPLGRAGRVPPRRVQDPVLGIARGAELGPVAILSTRRTVTLLRGEGGAVLAEVADDSVTATLLSVTPDQPATVEVWREVEVELVDGDEELLAAVVARVEAAGARPSGSASKLARVLAPRLAALDGAVPQEVRKPKKATAGEIVRTALAAQVQALQDADLMVRTDQAEGVHDLRVACRRIRSILAAFRPVLDRARTDGIREELRWLGQEFSGARDGEVALEHLRALVRQQPVELVLGPVAARLQQEEIKDHAKGSAQGLRTLRSERYLALRDALDALVAEPPFTDEAQQPAAPVLRAVLQKTVHRLRRDVRAARATEQRAERDHLLHDTRKAAKRVRYTAEVAAPVLGAAAADLVQSMKDLQDLLGERQDTVVTRDECRRLGLAAFAAGENAWTYGRLEALEEARADRAEQEFWARWPEFKAQLKQATRG